MSAINRWVWIIALSGSLLGVTAAKPRPTEPPEVQWLSIATHARREKPLVRFSHRLHAQKKVACDRCHHDYRGKRNVWQQGQPVQACQACHGLTWQGDRMDIKNAFHRQCKGCHLKLRQQQRQAGPIRCQECHRPG